MSAPTLNHRTYPINQAIHYAGTHTIHNHRPAMVNIFAPTLRMKPSAYVNLGPHSCSVRSESVYLSKNRVPYLAHDFIISSFQLTPKATLDCFVRWFAVPHFCILLQ